MNDIVFIVRELSPQIEVFTFLLYLILQMVIYLEFPNKIIQNLAPYYPRHRP